MTTKSKRNKNVPVPGRNGDPNFPRAKDGSFRGAEKGAKHKATLIMEKAQAAVRKRFPDEFGKGKREFDPIVEMALIGADPENSATLRLNAVAKMAPYVHTRLATVEVVGGDGGPIQVNHDAQGQLAKILGLTPGEVENEPEPEIIDVTPIEVPDE